MRLLLISAQRSGTNWAMDVLGRVPGVLCLRDVFNPRGVFGAAQRGGVVLAAAAEIHPTDGADERHPELVTAVRADPAGFLDLADRAAAGAGCAWIGATVFPGHLTDVDLDRLLDAPGTTALILRRRQIDRALSYAKARHVGAWKGIDTTGTRPAVAPATVLRQIALADDWFGGIGARLARLGTPCLRLSYEDHVTPGAEALLAAVAQEVRSFPWRPGDPVPRSGLTRQDRTTDPFDRVANGTEIQSALRREGRLEAALRLPPLTDLATA